MRPTKAKINLENLNTNFLNIRKKVKTSKVLAVVKANAYGHGVKEIVTSLNTLEKKPEYFGVAISDEGVEVSKLKVQQPILIFEPLSLFNIEEIVKYKLIPTVFDESHIELLEKTKKKVRVHVKIDTGMGRLGVNYSEAVSFIEKASKLENIIVDGIYTHFATSDAIDKEFANKQLLRFKEIIKTLKEKKINYGLAHCANSGAILDMPDSYLDMVRPGISLYGYYPSLETSESIKLKPVMSIESKVASVKEFPEGESVSYSRLYFTDKKTKIISVPMGYADGYNRNFTNKTECIIKGKKYKQAGRVTMDRIMFDVGLDNIKVGDDVILLGSSGKLKIDAWDFSKIINTIPYEITCNISKRVPREYLK